MGGIRSRLEDAEDLCRLHHEISLRCRSCFPAIPHSRNAIKNCCTLSEAARSFAFDMLTINFSSCRENEAYFFHKKCVHTSIFLSSRPAPEKALVMAFRMAGCKQRF